MTDRRETTFAYDNATGPASRRKDAAHSAFRVVKPLQVEPHKLGWGFASIDQNELVIFTKVFDNFLGTTPGDSFIGPRPLDKPPLSGVVGTIGTYQTGDGNETGSFAFVRVTK